MISNNVRVSTRITGEDSFFCVETVVNGQEMDCPINVIAIKEGEIIAWQVKKLVDSVYKKAYRDGYGMCQAVIRDAIGLKK